MPSKGVKFSEARHKTAPPRNNRSGAGHRVIPVSGLIYCLLMNCAVIVDDDGLATTGRNPDRTILIGICDHQDGVAKVRRYREGGRRFQIQYVVAGYYRYTITGYRANKRIAAGKRIGLRAAISKCRKRIRVDSDSALAPATGLLVGVDRTDAFLNVRLGAIGQENSQGEERQGENQFLHDEQLS